VDTTVTVFSCEISEKNAWKSALIGIDVSVYFSWEYLSALKSNYPEGIYLLKIHNDSGGLITFYSKRTKDQKSYDIFSPYALDGIYIWGNSDQVIAGFIDFLRKNNVVTFYLCSHPKYSISVSNFFKAHRVLYVIDLRNETSLLWKMLHPNHRYEINKFSKLKVEIVTDKSLLEASFLRLYHETFERVQANNSYNFSNDFLSSLINSEIAYVSGALIDGKIECVVVFLVYNNWAEYYINASSTFGRNATRTLIWGMIIQLKALGIEYVNLGGGVNENDSLDQFKKKFGGYETSLNIWKGIALKDVFDELCKEYNVSTELTTYFPPYWINNR
jgi:hypothetical protein